MKSLLFFFVIFLFSTSTNARRFEVGGNGAWVSNPPENYQTWAQKSRFRVHDTLYFNYAKGTDSVLEVNKADFDGCNTKNPIKKMDDGESEISLDRSGPFYFISGNEDNCNKGQKLTVVVLSSRTPSTAPPPQSAAPGTLPPPPTTPPGAHSPKSYSPMTSPPSPPKSSSPVSPSSAPVTSPPGSMAPKSSSPTTSPPGSMAPKSSSPASPSSAPVTSPPGPMAPDSSSPGTSPPGSMAPKSSSAVSPSMAPVEPPSSPSSFSPTESPPSLAPSGADMGPSGAGPSTSGDITSPSEAPGKEKSSAHGIVLLSVTTALSLVLTIVLLV